MSFLCSFWSSSHESLSLELEACKCFLFSFFLFAARFPAGRDVATAPEICQALGSLWVCALRGESQEGRQCDGPIFWAYSLPRQHLAVRPQGCSFKPWKTLGLEFAFWLWFFDSLKHIPPYSKPKLWDGKCHLCFTGLMQNNNNQHLNVICLSSSIWQEAEWGRGPMFVSGPFMWKKVCIVVLNLLAS